MATILKTMQITGGRNLPETVVAIAVQLERSGAEVYWPYESGSTRLERECRLAVKSGALFEAELVRQAKARELPHRLGDNMNELPHPDSEELRRLIPGVGARAVYRLLYENRGNPLSMLEIRDRLRGELQEQEQLDRRKRDLHPHFEIRSVREGKTYKYELVGRKPESVARSRISLRLRAQILSEGRCRNCGRTPRDDGIKLVVDHIIPQGWGGTDDENNLQPLCEDCNQGKKDLFSDFDEYSDKIRLAIHHEEPHRRIGELLKAFGDDWVPSSLIGVVASAVQHQEDWQKRLRELRTLGWKIEVQRRREGGRVRTFYRATHWEPWPKGSIRAEITRRERTSGR